MTNTTSKRALRIRLALAAFVGVPLLLATSAFAQDVNAAPPANPAPAGGEATATGVVVTGSNIPTAEEVTASPVDTITSTDVARSGSQDVLQILQKRNPDFVGGGNIGSSNANIASGATQGGSFVTLRGLPSLVLYEGRRIADSAAISAGGFQFSDVRLFPAALIARIEVLKDGASAIYGSDAVGGVINIFLKRDFTGVETGVRYGFSLESGVAQRTAYVIAGVGNETTHVTASFNYSEIDPLYNRERDYSQRPAGATATYAGAGRNHAAGAGTQYVLLDPTLNSPFDAGVVPGSVGTRAPTYYTNPGLMGTYAPATLTQVFAFDLTTRPTTTQGQRNTDVNASFSHQIFGKQLEIYGDFLYAHDTDFSQLNAQPLSNSTGIVIPAGFVGSTGIAPGAPGYVPTIYNPFNFAINRGTLSGINQLIIGNRYQTNPREFHDDTNFYRLLGGVKSQITPDWSFDAAGYYSNYAIDFANNNLVVTNQINAMIAGTATDPNGNLIAPLNFFARNPIDPTGIAGPTLAQFNSIFGTNIRKQNSFQQAFDATITGFPLTLPGGKLGVSFGGAYYINGFSVVDSPEVFVGSVPIQDINVTRGQYAFFGELSVPIVGSSMKVPGVYSLDIDLAGRYDKYEGIDTDSYVPKLSLRYAPIKDLTLRATYSNSFVAPNLYQLYGPTSTGFSGSITFNGVKQDQAQVQTGANALLVPSTAESYTAGLVYSPHFIPGLTITADYFRTLQQQIVGTVDITGGATILGSVNALGAASPYATLVAFNNFPGQPGAVSATTFTGPKPPNGYLNGNLINTFYLNTNVNIGAARVEGFDLSAHYDLDLKAAGSMEFGVNAVLFTLNDVKSVSSHHYYNISGLDFAEGGGANPDYKLTAFVEYRFQGATVGVNSNYIPEMLNAVGQNPEFNNVNKYQVISDYVTFDGRLSYAFHRNLNPETPPPVETKDAKDAKSVAGMKAAVGSGASASPFDRMLDGFTLTVGCNNMLDRTPPFVYTANASTDTSVYDPYGRFLYFEVSKKF